MTRTSKSISRSMLMAGLAALVAAPAMLASTSAQADVRVRVGGSVSVKVRAPHVRVRVRSRGHRARGVVVRRRSRYSHPVTHPVHHRLHLSGGIYVGASAGYSTPPPPPNPGYDCDVPAYYTTAYRPAYAAPPVPRPIVVRPAVVAEPMGPRLGIGVFAGGMYVEETQSDDVGLIGRYRLTRGLAIEGELAKTSLTDGGEQRRAGAAVLWDLSSRSRLSPYLLAGMGRWGEAGYGEVGVGLTYRVTPRFHLAADLRAGGYDARSDLAPVAKSGGQIAPAESNAVGYTRTRLSALVYF